MPVETSEKPIELTPTTHLSMIFERNESNDTKMGLFLTHSILCWLNDKYHVCMWFVEVFGIRHSLSARNLFHLNVNILKFTLFQEER